MGVTRFAPGDRVFGMPRFPKEAACYAEYVIAPSRQLARVPSVGPTSRRAPLPLAGLTAWQALVETADVGPGIARARARCGGGRRPSRRADRKGARRACDRNVERGASTSSSRSSARTRRSTRAVASRAVEDVDVASTPSARRRRARARLRDGGSSSPSSAAAVDPLREPRHGIRLSGSSSSLTASGSRGSRSRRASARTSRRRSRSRRPPAHTSRARRAARRARSCLQSSDGAFRPRPRRIRRGLVLGAGDRAARGRRPHGRDLRPAGGGDDQTPVADSRSRAARNACAACSRADPSRPCSSATAWAAS